MLALLMQDTQPVSPLTMYTNYNTARVRVRVRARVRASVRACVRACMSRLFILSVVLAQSCFHPRHSPSLLSSFKVYECMYVCVCVCVRVGGGRGVCVRENVCASQWSCAARKHS